MSLLEQIANILAETLQLNNAESLSDLSTPLLGDIPEFDSMAVVSILTALEEKFGFFVDDDEIDAEVFETVGALVSFVEQKIG